MSQHKTSALHDFLMAVTRHPVSLLGAAITSASAAMFLTLFVAESLGVHGGPYLGIISFIVIPSLFVFGLALIPAGTWLQRRRVRLGGETAGFLPIIDLNVNRTRNLALLVVALTMINVVVLAVATYKGIEVMETTAFCGQTCHSVMNPEFTTYQRSPHARVACVDCHIGPGADWFVKSKLSGSWQLVSVNLNLYPRPIPSPVHNLRPARETCEQCHWPNKFVGDRLKIITHYQDDEANTQVKTVLGVRVGGRQGTISQGIHWHVDPGVQIRYRSDEKRENVYEIELSKADGTRKRFVGPEASTPAAKSEAWRIMDCVDCHNRPTHIYRMPQTELDRALEEGRIARSLPFVRREGLKALQLDYPSQEEARSKIGETIRGFYGANYPALVASAKDTIDAAATALSDIYCWNVFPSMNIRWGTYPNHIGHQYTPGCFRCHDGDHKAADGDAISQDCGTCHAVLAMDEPDPPILKELQP